MEDDIQTILSILPIWDESIWAPLQDKRYVQAGSTMEKLFRDFSLEEWETAYWGGMFLGIPMVLGDLNEDDWKKGVQPQIVSAILNSANGKSFSVVLQSMPSSAQEEFQRIFWQVVPGNNVSDKLSWLKANRPSIYGFVIAAPAQNVGLDPNSPNNKDTDKYLKRYRFVTDDLQRAIYSYEKSQAIYRTCTNHHLSDDKTRQVAAATGRVILGFVHIDDFTQTIEETTGMDHRVCSEIANDIRSSAIGGLAGSIASIYEPADSDGEKTVTAKTISLEDIGAASQEESIPVETAAPVPGVTLKEQKPDSPFILHEEDVPEGNITQKSVFRSVTSPLGGFFLKKRPPEETKSPFAKLQIPGLKPEEKRVVHYSETRTPLSQLEEPSFINVGEAQPLAQPETFAPKENKEVEPPAGGSTSDVAASGITIKPKAEEVPDKVFAAPKKIDSSPAAQNDMTTENIEPVILGDIKRPEPKVEGNTLDLRND